MKRSPTTPHVFLLLLAPLLLLGASCQHSSAPSAAPAHFADPDRLISPESAQNLERRLLDFTRRTGHPVFLRLAAHAPPDTAGRKINAHVEALATQLGLAQDGVLVFYSADRDEWKLWLGDALLPVVMGRPGTAADFTPDGALHARKDALLAPAAKISAAQSPATERRLALACSALLDTLLPALTPKP
jgi:hypothetical protein